MRLIKFFRELKFQYTDVLHVSLMFLKCPLLKQKRYFITQRTCQNLNCARSIITPKLEVHTTCSMRLIHDLPFFKIHATHTKMERNLSMRICILRVCCVLTHQCIERVLCAELKVIRTIGETSLLKGEIMSRHD